MVYKTEFYFGPGPIFDLMCFPAECNKMTKIEKRAKKGSIDQKTENNNAK